MDSIDQEGTGVSAQDKVKLRSRSPVRAIRPQEAEVSALQDGAVGVQRVEGPQGKVTRGTEWGGGAIRMYPEPWTPPSSISTGLQPWASLLPGPQSHPVWPNLRSCLLHAGQGQISG